MNNDTDARLVLSEMIDITESTIDRTFGRHPDLDALYRRCPTAFWLAPDCDGVLPALPPGPTLPAPSLVLSDAPPDDAPPPAAHGLARGVGMSVVAAGPIFAATAMMLEQAQYDRHLWDPLGRALVSLIAFPLTITFGAVLAVLPILIGALSLGAAGTRMPTVRKPAVWALTGGVMGLAIAALFDAGATVGLALIATSIACAGIARAAVDWNVPEPA